MLRCPRCKRAITAIRVGDSDRWVPLPHMADGSKVKFGETCRKGRP